jgi:hypothetical protein
MSYFDPERQAELHRQRILEEMEEIHLQDEALRGKNTMSRALAVLGAWMVARGERLRQNNSRAHYTELNKKIAHR